MLEIKNLNVRYRGAKKSSIGDITLNIQEGDIMAILGPSGCGKTTLLHVIAGLLNEKKAEISGILDWKSNLNKPNIRMVFQEAMLLPWRTVEKNVALGLEIKNLSKEEISRKVNEMLNVVGLSENAKNLPHELSVGMQQRVNFARALVCEPDLLLLDEPFSALDIETKRKLQEQFSNIIKEKNITTVFVTHNIQEANAMAEKIIVLSKGPSIINQVIENGTKIEQLKENQNYFDEYE